jgi:hypothetical protein
MAESAWSILNRDKSFFLRKVERIESRETEANRKVAEAKVKLRQVAETQPQASPNARERR